MKYTGTKSDECTITIHNVTEEFNCTWAGRLDEDLTNRELTKRNSLRIFVKKLAIFSKIFREKYVQRE